MFSARTMLGLGLMFAAGASGQGTRPTFEAVSIKPTAPGGRGGGIRAMPGGQEFVTEGVSLRFMTAFMFWVPLRQVTGGPAWLDTELWDIKAKADSPHDLEDLREMFRNLLADEFRLKLRKDVKEGAVYALSVEHRVFSRDLATSSRSTFQFRRLRSPSVARLDQAAPRQE